MRTIDERLEGHINYSIDLQRIIECLCAGREIREPESGARFHYDMAVTRHAVVSEMLDALTTIAAMPKSDDGFNPLTMQRIARDALQTTPTSATMMPGDRA